MLTLFPSLLSYQFFVPAALRIAVALAFGYQLIGHFKHKHGVAAELEQNFKWIGGKLANSLALLLILVEAAVGILLFVGAWTQLVALLSALGFIKMAYFNDKLPTYAPLPRSTYLLLALISLSLVILGAGAIAFDLPL